MRCKPTRYSRLSTPTRMAPSVWENGSSYKDHNSRPLTKTTTAASTKRKKRNLLAGQLFLYENKLKLVIVVALVREVTVGRAELCYFAQMLLGTRGGKIVS